MPNNIDNALLAAIRSMEKTIIPAISKDNPLANEQAAIINQLLQFLRDRIPYIPQRDRLELKIYADMVNELIDDIALLLPDHLEDSQRLTKEADSILIALTPEPGLIAQITEELRSTLSQLVRVSYDRDEQQGGRIESAIVRGSKRVLDLQRAWFIPTGLVADSNSIPDLNRQIRMEKV